MAPDPSILGDVDPYRLMAAETARIDAYLARLDGKDWSVPTACADWDRRQLLAHLAASEEYNRACMNDSIPAFFEQYQPRGVTGIDSMNAIWVADRDPRTPDELIDEWRREAGATLQQLSARSGEEVPTMVGPYPADWQAWHLANELAIHADDLGVPVTAEEAEARQAWLTRFARFALTETDKDVSIVPDGAGRWRVSAGGAEVSLDDADLIAAVNARALPSGAPLDEPLRSALSFMG